MRWTKQRLAWQTNWHCLVCGKATVYSHLMGDLFCKECDASLATSDWANGHGTSIPFDKWLIQRTKDHVAAQYRDRERRVVRVFWRVRVGTSRMIWLDFTSRARAWRYARIATNRKVYRVTVRKRGKS